MKQGVIAVLYWNNGEMLREINQECDKSTEDQRFRGKKED